MKELNESEIIAKRYLMSIYHSCTINSEDPPDFVLGKDIAIEVSRLDQQDLSSMKDEMNAKTVPLENDERAIQEAISEVCTYFPAKRDEDSKFIKVHIRRPIGDSVRKIKKNATKVLRQYLNGGLNFPDLIPISRNGHVKLSVLPYKATSDYEFILEPIGDHDVGGFVDWKFIQNLNYYIKRKEQTIINKYTLYKEWWLMLVHNMIALKPYNYTEVFKFIDHNGLFDKIIIINKKAELIHECTLK